ncbi:response regulator [Metabacillus herbersteinensis]|uniref:Response regulator n=1 Tax=Metabacillus herbersteinensis TaxID=283816 RepID=A0ABV6GA36_9BACI
MLLADDERIILEGISKVVDWESLNTELVDTAKNGLEAYEKIVQHQPHIVISDIKMPGLDGLSLVKKVHEEFPSIQFILLSGFSEFDYARTAMQYGVKNYLLKPCNELKISEALNEVITEIKCTEDQKCFIDHLKKDLDKAKPYIKAQLLTELLSSNKDLAYYQKLIDVEISDQQVKLILFQLESEFSYEHIHAIKNIGSEIFGTPMLNTNIGEYALFLVETDGGAEKLQQQVKQIRDRFSQFYKIDTTVAISGGDYVRNVRNLYLEALECLKHRFYLGEGSIITKADITRGEPDRQNGFVFDEQQMSMLIKSGNVIDVSREISGFFEKLMDLRLGIPMTKSYCIQLFLAIVQTGNSERMQIYLDGISSIMQVDTVQQMHEYIKQAAVEITQDYFESYKSKQSTVIGRVISIMNEHLGNPELSLKLVAGKMLYMNADYLGKLFKLETGERFSSYLTKLRIEKAIEHIQGTEDVKIVTLAELIGFGDNPQYFSQVFKKYTGYTPTEYRRVP